MENLDLTCMYFVAEIIEDEKTVTSTKRKKMNVGNFRNI